MAIFQKIPLVPGFLKCFYNLPCSHVFPFIPELLDKVINHHEWKENLS